MIEYLKEPYKDKEIFNILDPLVKEWFSSKFKEFAPPQLFSIIPIHQRENILISSPTGSGKTLSAFMAVLNELINLDEKGKLEDKIYCVYISPLKALANDIEKNLNTPLNEMNKIYKKKNPEKELNVRVAIRTGDTKTYEKAKMLKNPPHILITTPESFAITLTTKKFRENFRNVQWCIIDEIHSLADSKRGVHLSLSLERLENLTYFSRVGLSATISPIEEVGKFLVGMKDYEKNEFRDCKIVDVNFLKKLDMKVLSPVENLIESDYEETHSEMYRLIDDLIQKHKTTLIFTNTRAATERVVHHLKENFPKNYEKIEEDMAFEEKEKAEISGIDTKSFIGAHHGSLSKEHRLNIENRLKKGELKCVVSSTSLELGIDIGYIDLVILLGSPKSVARGLQRIGRSGHKLHDKAKGKIIVLNRDDMVECAVLLKNAIEHKIDRIDIPENCLDVLAQQIFGIALEQPYNIEKVYETVKKSYCYRNLMKNDFDNIINYLMGEYVSLEERNVYAKIWYDEETGMIGKRGKLARVIYMTNIGTIPDESAVKVKILRRGSSSSDEYIGKIDEGFLERLKKGDIFVLGGKTYEFRYAQGMSAFVRSTANRPPTVPSWISESLPLSFDLAMEIQKFRRYMDEYFENNSSKEDVLDFINDYLYVDKNCAFSIYEYFRQQYDYREIPHDKKLIIEYYNEDGDRYAIFHSLYGRRVNDVLSRTIAYAVSKINKQDIEINISDNGFYLKSSKPIPALRALKLLKSEEIRKVAEISLRKTEVMARRFRHCASRALMILRSYKGKKKTVSRQQLSSRILMNAVGRIDKDFPILKEARREVLEDLMDIENTEKVIKEIEEGNIDIKEIFTKIPTPFAFNLISLGYLDIMKMEDKHEFLKRLHNMVKLKIDLENKGKNK
ncbi:ATP-dependent helicase [Candidatus Woesearchaeota archaeon]|nr:ATP-dependent helicase [Candidatus Woesearchaeota archaeon]